MFGALHVDLGAVLLTFLAGCGGRTDLGLIGSVDASALDVQARQDASAGFDALVMDVRVPHDAGAPRDARVEEMGPAEYPCEFNHGVCRPAAPDGGCPVGNRLLAQDPYPCALAYDVCCSE